MYVAAESTLDIEVQLAMSPNAQQTYWTDKAWIYDMALSLFNQAQSAAGTLPSLLLY